VNGGLGANFAVVADRPLHYMVALYSYNPIELSPNIDADVSISALVLHCKLLIYLILEKM